MENPFENIELFNYSKYLQELLKDKKTGDVFYIDTNQHKKSIAVVRATLKHIFDKKIATKTDKQDKNILWVKVL